jgi:prepilin-type N-terminal cleavage/methylation domain-containing protein
MVPARFFGGLAAPRSPNSSERTGEAGMRLATSPRAGYASQAGFTLAELLVVASIVAVVIAMSIPNLSRAIDTAKLKGAAQTLVGVYQDARMRATQSNTPFEVLVSPAGVAPARLCVDLNGDGQCSTGDPLTLVSGGVALNNTNPPAGLNAVTLGFNPVQTESSVMRDQNNDLVPGLAWNGLGVPCQRNSSTSPCLAVGWVQYLQLQRSGAETLYAAVSVSPTGRIRAWTYIPSANGNGNWF